MDRIGNVEQRTRKRGVRWLAWLLTVSMMASLFVVPQISASADDGFVGTQYENTPLYYQILSSREAVITDCYFGASSATIPESIEGCSVTGIAANAFADCDQLTSITIPSTITNIAANAFDGCTKLTTIDVASRNEYYISSGGVLLDKNKTKIVCFPLGKKSIKYLDFQDCNFTSITIPSNVTSVANCAFYRCRSLTSVTIPSSVTSFSGLAFEGCTKLATINVNSSNARYSSVSGILFDKNQTKILRYPQAKSGTSYTILSTVKSIDQYAFGGCTSLTSITIPSGVTSIGDYAFCNCSGLTGITIPSGVTSIGDGMFQDCSSLTGITIPSGVTSIYQSAFDGCTKLATFSVNSSNTKYSSASGVLFNKNKTEIIKYPQAKSGTSYPIPTSVTSIGDSAFANCNNLTSLGIPTSVTSIGGSAFFRCRSLTSVTIPSSVTSIGDAVFLNCRSLTSIAIPSSVKSIGRNAFYVDNRLEDVEYGGTTAQWNSITFSTGNDPLKKAATKITKPNSINKQFGKDTSFKLSNEGVSVRSTGAVTYSSSNTNVATVTSDGTVTINSVGSSNITVSVAANGNYGAKSKLIPLFVDHADATITASDVTKTYGDAPFKLGATVNSGGTLSYSSSNSHVATVESDGTVTITGAGTSVITIYAQGNGNYGSAEKTITLTVNKTAPTWSGATTFNKTYGDAKFGLGQSVTGGGNLTYKSNNTDIVDVDSSGNVTIAGNGTATITVTAAASTNYNDATRDVTVIVSKADPTITASDKKVTYGDAAFKLGATVNSGGTLTYSSNDTSVATIAADGTVTIKGVGSTAITVNAAANGNYKAGSKQITVTVNAANPGAPTNVTATPGANSINLAWKAPTFDGDGKGNLSYKINWGTNANNLDQTKTTTSLAETIDSLNPAQQYYFEVRAINSSGKTGSAGSANGRPYSNEITYNGGALSDYGVVGQNKTLQLPTPTKGSGTYTYEVVYGDLPAGMSLNKTKGQLIGTPRESGVFEVDIKAADTTSGAEAIGTITFCVVEEDPFNGEGSEGAPYEISDAADLIALSIVVNNGNNLENKFVKMTANIEFDKNVNNNFVPIGGNGQELTFNGTFDGDGHYVSGLNIDASNLSVGLFGLIAGATIKNVGIVDSVIKNEAWNTGAIVGLAKEGSQIVDCYNSGTTVSSSQNALGGIVGQVADKSKVERCYNAGTVLDIKRTDGNVAAIGGITGFVSTAEGSETNCYNTGTVGSNNATQVGGVVGRNDGSVTNCYNVGRVNHATEGIDAAACGAISGMMIGGTINNSYSLAGVIENGNSYYAGIVKTVEEMKAPGFVAELAGDSEGVWFADFANKNDGYPVLWKPSFKGEGTEEAPYEISNVAELNALSEAVNGGYDFENEFVKMTANIEFDKNVTNNFKPIASYSNLKRFRGTFDGQGHTISGLNISIPSDSNINTGIALFGAITNATIKNVGIVDSVIENNSTGWGTAALVGAADYNSVIENCYTSNTSVSSKGVTVAGVVADVKDSTKVVNCYNTGTITADSHYIGGVIGYINTTDAQVSNCYNTGAINVSDTTDHVGGVAGISKSVIKNCYNVGKITGATLNYGAVLGTAMDLDNGITNCYSLAGVAEGGAENNAGAIKTAEEMKAPGFADEINKNAGETVYKCDKTLLNEGYPIFASVAQEQIPVTVTFDKLNQDYDGNAKPVSFKVTNTLGKEVPITSDEYTITYDGKSEAPTTPGKYEVVFKLNEGNEYYTLDNNTAKAELNILTYKPGTPVVSKAVSMNSSILIESIEETNEKVTGVDEFTVYVCAPGTTTPVKTLSVTNIVNKKAENVLVDGLQNGSKYDVYVTATNEYGTCDTPSETQNIQVGLPTTPEDFRLIQKEAKTFDISFKPSDGQGSKIIGYDLIIGGTVNAKEVPETTLTITEKDYSISDGHIVYPYMAEGRKNGDTLTVQVVAKSETANMKSDPTDKLTGKIGAPDAPVLTSKVDSEGVSLSWTEPETYDNVAQYYTVHITDKNGDVKLFETANASALKMRIDTGEYTDKSGNKYPFECGEKYTVTVTCNNGNDGLPSNAEEFTFGAPPKVEDPIVEPGQGSLTVHWDKPEDEDPAYPIVGYNVYLNNKAHTQVTWEEVDGKYQLYLKDLTKENAEPVLYKDLQDNLDHFDVTITGLKNGLTYTFNGVTAFNEYEGPLPAPNPDDPNKGDVTPSVPADKPTDVKAIGSGSKSVKLNWSAPMKNGGSPVKGYIIEAYKVSHLKDYDTFAYEEVESSEPVQTYGSEQEPIQGTSYTAGGLETEYGYEFKVYAVNAAGKGEASNSSNVAKTFTKPGKANDIVVKSELGLQNPEIKVKWKAPEHDGGTQVLGYVVMRTSATEEEKMVGEKWCDENNKTLPDELEITIPRSMNVNGVRYVYTVYTYNAVTGTENNENGVPSDKVTAFAGTVAPPEDVEVTPNRDAQNTFTVSWNIDKYKDDISYIDHFNVYVTTDGVTEEITTDDNKQNSVKSDPCTLGKEYTVQVAAVTKIDKKLLAGAKSVPPKTITMGAPDKVQNVIATPGKEKVTVTWDPVGADTTQYTVYLNGGKAGEIGNDEDPIPADTPMEISKDSLVGGQGYKVIVVAKNNYGTSTSDEVKATPYSEPDAPVVSDIKPANKAFSFKFEDGSSNGTTIEPHKLYIYNDTTSAYEEVTSDVTINETDKTVNVSVAENKKYTFYLAAVGSVEVNGNKSELESAAPENGYKVTSGVPLPPAHVTADAGEGSATILFDKSEDIEGAPVKEYYIEQITTDGAVPTKVKTVPRTSAEKYSVTIDGLSNRTEYSYVVVANNGTDSDYSQVVSVTPGAPNRPEIEVKEGNKQLDVTWKECKPNVDYYTVYVNGNENGSTSKTSYTIENLDNGTPYEITVKAHNDVAFSTPSDSKKGTPGGAPDAVDKDEVHIERIYANDRCGLELTWPAPNNNGRTITEYKVTCDGVDENDIAVSIDETTKAGTAVIKNLELDTTYKIDIIANNGADSDPCTVTAKTFSLPGAPTMRRADSKNRNIIAKWTVPDNGGSPITGYTVYMRPANGGETITKTYGGEGNDPLPTPNSNNEISVTISDDRFTPQALYNVSVLATTFANGSESKSLEVEIAGSTLVENPTEPTDVKLTPGNQQVLVTWHAPVSDGGIGITEYIIYAGSDPDAMGKIGSLTVDPNDPDAKTKTYPYTDNNNGKGLTNDIPRYYKVKAKNAAGYESPEFGYPDPPYATPTDKGVPSWGEEGAWPTFDNDNGVSAYEVNAAWDTMTVTWNPAKADEVGGTIYYDVYVDNKPAQDGTGLTTTQYSFGDLVENHVYGIEIYAYTIVGGVPSGEFSAPIYAANKLNIRKEAGYPYDPIYKEGVYANIDRYYEGHETSPAGRPSAPQTFILSKTVKNDALATWTSPKEDGNRPIDHYNVYVDGSDGSQKVYKVDANQNQQGNAAYRARALSDESAEKKPYEQEFKMDAGVVYTVYVTAVNTVDESGEGEKTENQNIGPVIILEAGVSEDDVENIDLTWTPVYGDNVAGYVLFGAGAQQDISYEIGGDGKAHATYEGVINSTYNLSVAVKYTNGTVAAVSNTETVSTGTINAPILNKPTGSETDPYEMTVTWDAPDNADKVDLAGYLIYVNGEKASDIIDKDTLTGTVHVDNSCTVKVVGVCDHYNGTDSTGIGTMSDPQSYNIIEGADPSIIVPRIDPDGIIIDRDENGKVNGLGDENYRNVTITWSAGDADDTHTVPATAYNIFAGGVSIGSHTVNEGETEFTESFHLELGEYNVAVTPVAGGNQGEPDSITISVKNDYQAPTAPKLSVDIDPEKTKATVTWTPQEDGVRYELWVNEALETDECYQGYEYTLDDNTYIYRFLIKAVKDYEGEPVSNDSNLVTVDVSTYLSNAPTILGSLSSGTETKVFWKAPTDKLKYEVGDIEQYSVYDVDSDTELGTVDVDADPEHVYVFTINTFANSQERKNIRIRACKNISGDIQYSATSEWTATPACNKVQDENDYLNDRIEVFPDSVDNLDKNGDGFEDGITPDPIKPAFEIPITINVEDAVVDVFELGVDGKHARTVWEAAPIKDGKIILEAKTEDLTGKTFNVVVRKLGHTSWTVSKVPYEDLAEVGSKLTDVVLWLGDYDANGIVEQKDIKNLQRYINESITPELKPFDIDGDGLMSLKDIKNLQKNVSNDSVVILWNN